MPTPDDVEALETELAGLRTLPRHLLNVTSSRILEAAVCLAAEPQGRVLLHLSRVLYLLAHETEAT
jgi:hypothetical protein